MVRFEMPANSFMKAGLVDLHLLRTLEEFKR